MQLGGCGRILIHHNSKWQILTRKLNTESLRWWDGLVLGICSVTDEAWGWGDEKESFVVKESPLGGVVMSERVCERGGHHN